jgi:hypothetical protein
MIFTVYLENFTGSECLYQIVLKLILAQSSYKVYERIIFHWLEIECDFVIPVAFHAESKFACITSVHNVLSCPMLLTNRTHHPSGLACFSHDGRLLVRQTASPKLQLFLS